MDDDPHAEGRKAARENIPAEANPYRETTREHARWQEGYESVAVPGEARESEG